MKISSKISFVILTTGISVLIVLSLAMYTINRTMAVKLNLTHAEIHAKDDQIIKRSGIDCQQSAGQGMMPT